MKKTLIVIPNTKLGGAENILKEINYYLKDRHSVDLFFLKKSKENNWEQVKNITYFSNVSIHLGMINLFFKLIFQKKKYDYIFSSHILVNSYLGLLLKIKLIKTENFIARESTNTFVRFKGIKLKVIVMLYKLGYKKVNLLICQTNEMRKNLIQNLNWIEKHTKVVTIPNPIKIKKTNSDLHSINYKFIVSAGRLIDEKGYPFLINTFEKFTEKYNKEIKLIILGEGKNRIKLENLIKEKGLTDKVLLPGFVTNVLDYFNQAEVCIVSSKIEGFPNVLLQMMSQNTKVISTLCADGIENIDGVQTVDFGDVDNLSYSIFKILQMNTLLNREKFDNELSRRSIESFMRKIEIYE